MMQRLGVREEELQERFVRSRGPGGQRTNKASTCVVLRHGPNGLEVRCEQERQQSQNRLRARRLLLERLEAMRRRAVEDEAASVAKLRRQKRRRPAPVQEALLAAKRLRSQKKTLRRVRLTDVAEG